MFAVIVLFVDPMVVLWARLFAPDAEAPDDAWVTLIECDPVVRPDAPTKDCMPSAAPPDPTR